MDEGVYLQEAGGSFLALSQAHDSNTCSKHMLPWALWSIFRQIMTALGFMAPSAMATMESVLLYREVNDLVTREQK